MSENKWFLKISATKLLVPEVFLQENYAPIVNDWGASAAVNYHTAAYDWMVNGKQVPVKPEETRMVLDIIEKSKKENDFKL